MKSILKSLKILIFFNIVFISKEELCQYNEINLDDFGNTCITIEDFLENEDLVIESVNLLYLTSNNNGIIEKNNYKLTIFNLNEENLSSFNINKSKLYISDTCIKTMEESEKIKLDKSNSILILVYNYNKMNINNLPEIFFVIRQSGENSKKKYINSKTFDFSICSKAQIFLDTEININELKYDYNKEIPIDVNKISHAIKKGVDLFDPNSEFLNDICFKYTNENKKDVTLDLRFKDYYQNITLCNESLNSHYIGSNYSSMNEILIFRCVYGYFQNEEEQNAYIDKINNKKKIYKNFNINVVTCYKQLFKIMEVFFQFWCLYFKLLCILFFVAKENNI